MTTIIENIKEVYCIRASRLKNIYPLPNGNVIMSYWRNWQKLDTIGLSSCTIEDSWKDNCRFYSIELKAKLADRFDDGGEAWCFKLVTVSGAKWLLGDSEEPQTLIANEAVKPASPSEPSVCELSVSYKNTHGLLRMIE